MINNKKASITVETLLIIVLGIMIFFTMIGTSGKVFSSNYLPRNFRALDISSSIEAMHITSDPITIYYPYDMKMFNTELIESSDFKRGIKITDNDDAYYFRFSEFNSMKNIEYPKFEHISDNKPYYLKIDLFNRLIIESDDKKIVEKVNTVGNEKKINLDSIPDIDTKDPDYNTNKDFYIHIPATSTKTLKPDNENIENEWQLLKHACNNIKIINSYFKLTRPTCNSQEDPTKNIKDSYIFVLRKEKQELNQNIIKIYHKKTTRSTKLALILKNYLKIDKEKLKVTDILSNDISYYKQFNEELSYFDDNQGIIIVLGNIDNKDNINIKIGNYLRYALEDYFTK